MQQPFIDVFSTMVRLISGPSLLPMPADIQGQAESTTGGLSVTERCNRLALLVTSPLILADRCEECSRLLGKNHWLTWLFPQRAIVRALTVSYLHICYLLFVQGQKVESVDNIAGWWRREPSTCTRPRLVPTEVTELEELGRQAASVFYQGWVMW